MDKDNTPVICLMDKDNIKPYEIMDEFNIKLFCNEEDVYLDHNEIKIVRTGVKVKNDILYSFILKQNLSSCDYANDKTIKLDNDQVAVILINHNEEPVTIHKGDSLGLFCFIDNNKQEVPILK